MSTTSASAACAPSRMRFCADAMAAVSASASTGFRARSMRSIRAILTSGVARLSGVWASRDGIQHSPVGLGGLVDASVSGIALLDVGLLIHRIFVRPRPRSKWGGRFLTLARSADLRRAVFIDDDLEARVHGNLGRLHLSLFEIPFVDVLPLVGALEAERPAPDLREVSLEEPVERLGDLDLYLVDCLGSDIALLRAFLGCPEFSARLYAD